MIEARCVRSTADLADRLADPARLSVLHATQLLGSDSEPSFDRLSRLATKVLGVPVALVSLVTEDHQFFKSCEGLPAPWSEDRRTPLSHSFCQHVVATGRPFVIEDSRVDDRVRDNLAIADIGVISYLGIPLVIDGQVIGSYCAIGEEPRRWTTRDLDILSDLAESVVSEIVLRMEHRELIREQAAAEELRVKLDSALEAGEVADWTWDVREDKIYANPRLARIFGLPPSVAAGGEHEQYLRLIHPEDRPRFDAALALVVESGEDFAIDYRITPPSGGMRWIEARGKRVTDETGRTIGLSGVLVDITDRKLVESARNQNEEFQRLVFDSVKDFSVFTMSRDGRITTWNTGAENVFGYAESEILGRPFRQLFSPEDQASEKHLLEMNTARDRGRAVDERWHMRKGGELFYASGMVTPIVDEEGALLGYTKVARDMTAAKEANDRLVAQAHALEQADLRKNQFLAMLAHELRNPLGAISCVAQLARAEGDDEDLAEFHEVIQHQVRHLTHLIDDLLDVSRITQNKIELRKSTIVLGDVVARAVALARPQVDEKSHRLAVSVPDEPVHFVADPTRVEQMLSNLLTNAAKYSEPGRAIDLAANIEAGTVVFRIRDEGHGIDAEMIPEIFGLFTQVDTTLDRARGGLGIGLTLVRSLAEMHGGSVEAKSPGRGLGSEFILRLPIGRPAHNAPVRPGSRPLRAHSSDRVLLIDDSEVTNRLTARLLRNLGFVVATAHDGHEGIEVAERFDPAVILLDIGLPGLDGYEVARRLREREPPARSTLIIAVSGYGEEQARERSKAAGLDHHMTKPLDMDRLKALLGVAGS